MNMWMRFRLCFRSQGVKGGGRIKGVEEERGNDGIDAARQGRSIMIFWGWIKDRVARLGFAVQLMVAHVYVYTRSAGACYLLAQHKWVRQGRCS